MIKFILEIILLVATVALVYMGLCYDEEKRKYHVTKLSALGIIPIVLVVMLACVCIIPANTVGVRYSALKGTSEQTLQEGIHLITPFIDTVYKIDTTVQERTCKDVFVQTKDAQFVTMKINIKYKVEKGNAFKVYTGYKTLDNLNSNIIKNYAQNALNEVCCQYNVIDILGEKRNEFQTKTQETLSKMYSAEGVTLTAFVIEDIDAGDEIEKAIKNEAVAKKAVETAEQEKLKAEIDAEKKIIEAQGDADANAVKSRELTQEILTEQFIKKWDGKLPVVSSGQDLLIDPSAFITK